MADQHIFVYNPNTEEVHDTRHETNSCQIRDENGRLRPGLRLMASIPSNLGDGKFEWCDKCVGKRANV